MSKESIEDSATAEGLEQKTAKVAGNSVGMGTRLRMLVVGCWPRAVTCPQPAGTTRQI